MISAENIGHSISLEPKDAIAYLQGKGAQVTGDWTEWLDGQHARSFTVANVAKLDVLHDIQASMVKALKNGQTLEQWKTGLIPDLERKGWWMTDVKLKAKDGSLTPLIKGLTPSRLKTIYATNMQNAYMAGRYSQMMEEAVQRPWWQYVAILDNRTRPAHRAMNGRIFKYDDPGWQAFYPPCGYRCRCRVRNYSQADIERRKLPVSSTDGKLNQVQVPVKEHLNATVTRYTDTNLPGGKFQPDPGFSNNPAQTVWQPRLEAADVQLSRRYVDTAIQGPAFERFVAGKADGVFPVAVLQGADQAALQTEVSVAYLSSVTLKKQLERHPELTLSDYREIPNIVDQGEVYLDANEYTLIYMQPGSKLAYRLVLKSTKARDELFVQSLAKVNLEKVRRNLDNKAGRLR